MSTKGPTKGVHTWHDNARKCMVVGCEREARYRSISKVKRGYCSAHKELAKTRLSDESEQHMASRMLQRVGR